MRLGPAKLPAKEGFLGLEATRFDTRLGVRGVPPIHPAQVLGREGEVGGIVIELGISAEAFDEPNGAVGVAKLIDALEAHLVELLDPPVHPTLPEDIDEVREAVYPAAVLLVAILPRAEESLEHRLHQFRRGLFLAQNREDETLALEVVIGAPNHLDGSVDLSILDQTLQLNHSFAHCLSPFSEVVHDHFQVAGVSVCCSVNFHASSVELFCAATTVGDDVPAVPSLTERADNIGPSDVRLSQSVTDQHYIWLESIHHLASPLDRIERLQRQQLMIACATRELPLANYFAEPIVYEQDFGHGCLLCKSAFLTIENRGKPYAQFSATSIACSPCPVKLSAYGGRRSGDGGS